MCESDSSMKKLFVKCEKELCYVSCNVPLSRNKTHEPKQSSKFRSQDGPYAWLVCFSAILSLVITMGPPSSFGVIFPVLLDNFKESKAKTGKSEIVSVYTYHGQMFLKYSGILALAVLKV